MKLTREIKAAIIVISAILLFIWGYSFLKGRELFTNYKTYYVEYDNVEGIAPSSNVTLNGLVIGKVTAITINNVTGKLQVELQLKTDFPISKSSTAVIYEPGLIGGKQIAIHPNLNDKVLIEDGDSLKGNVELGLAASMGNKLVPIQQKIEKLLANADQLITGINSVLDKKGQADLKHSLAELSKTMEQFHKASNSVNGILDHNSAKINGVVTNFNKISGDFSKISDSLQKADLGKTVRDLNKTLATVDKIMANLQSGKGTMGKLLNDEALYANLSKTSKELELLLQDVRLNPTRYVNVSVFGKKNKPYVAPATDSIVKANN
ncbi:MlaD family protein [Flavobacterium sp. RSSA_27]|uniref:MlaD family protein n=1 Tax=Flavobacterium sp. RSSA_27 TaxID=3447667 RepID=UPI003F316B04